MTRLPMYLLLGLLLARPAQAERKAFAMGLYGGASASSFWGKDVGAWDITIFPSAGLSATMHLPAFLGVEFDALYLNKGGSFSRNEINPATNQPRRRVNTFTIHSLEFPLMLKITAPTESEVMPIFFGGPSLSYLASATSASEYVAFDATGMLMPEAADPLIPEMATVDWTLMLGAGLEWGLGTFQLRFNIGQNSLDETGRREVKTITAILLAGFIF